MIDASLVTERFLLLASIESADDKIEALCESSSLKIDEMVRDDTVRSDERLINAAASDAYYQWTLINSACTDDSFKSVKAGDISIENDASVSIRAAQSLKDESYAAIVPLLKDNAFYFSEVSIDDAQ